MQGKILAPVQVATRKMAKINQGNLILGKRICTSWLLLMLVSGLLSAQTKPNVLFLFVDDLGYHDLSCTGSKIYQTPHVDKLEKQSVTFSNAYANFPRCVPSRYALWSARYPVENHDVPDDGFDIGAVPPERNFVQMFNDAGFRTGFFGKWHLGDGPNSPKALGYEVSVAAGKAGSPISYFYPFNEPKGANRGVVKEPIEGLDEKAKEGDYLTDVLTTEFMQFIRETPRNRPFFGVLSFYAVHQPLEAKEADVETNRKEIAQFDFGNQPEYLPEGTGRTKMRQDNPTYAAMVENMDWNIGRILNLLHELGIEQNTIILFSSDHGGLSNDGRNPRQLATSNFPLRAGKGWLYEGGTRVPLFVKYPGYLKPAHDTKSIVLLMDLMPTLADLLLGKKATGVDGMSFVPLLQQHRNWERRTVFWHSNKARPNNTGEGNASSIRLKNWKLVNFYEAGQVELYDLKSDISEMTNLADKYPRKTRKLLEELNKWKASR
jgi:arylsulfatase A-like enzyme